ncbi:uncharacterized protein LOC8289183 [Ricinus communis]|uniref:Uncharacterized protein n=1 Tax=Ricinus communis TaxID=3988 RepID=B9RDR0_RICCO|nr:uncharacterized protein LOC8289183 [Ricinus communis]EEF50518.1 conserved hypothetical protein [Ricinus communis]|eukprot:XP_002511849.1 uncharacterized protein LOC8289183 [Ricinus communis]
MALNNQTRKTLETTAVDTTTTPRSPEEKPESVAEEEEEEEVEEEELEKLETEAKEMATRILEYRATLPDQLKTTFASILSAQRPILPDFHSGSDPGPAGDSNLGVGWQVKSSKSALLMEDDQKHAEKVNLLKNKISSNVSAMPIVLKRMKDCLLKIDNLDSNHGIIHPAFKKKTS